MNSHESAGLLGPEDRIEPLLRRRDVGSFMKRSSGGRCLAPKGSQLPIFARPVLFLNNAH